MAFPFPFWKIGAQCEHLTFTVKIGDVTTVKTPILWANARKCASFSKHVATLTPLSPEANIVLKKSMEKPHYTRRRTKKTTEFHSPWPNFHKTLQSKESLSKTLTFSATIPKLKLRAILIFLIVPTTTWLFVAYPYNMNENTKAAKISHKNSSLNWVEASPKDERRTSTSWISSQNIATINYIERLAH